MSALMHVQLRTRIDCLERVPHAKRVFGHDVPIVEAVRKEHRRVHILEQRRLIAIGPELIEVTTLAIGLLRDLYRARAVERRRGADGHHRAEVDDCSDQCCQAHDEQGRGGSDPDEDFGFHQPGLDGDIHLRIEADCAGRDRPAGDRRDRLRPER